MINIKKTTNKLLVAVTIIMLFSLSVTSAFATEAIPKSSLGKVTYIINGEVIQKEFSECITIYDADGKVVPTPRYVRPGGTFTLPNGGSASCNAEPLRYYTGKVELRASCSAGNVSKLRAEAQLWDEPDSRYTPMGMFTATKGTWYGVCKGYPPYQDASEGLEYIFAVRNVGSEPITVDSIVINF